MPLTPVEIRHVELRRTWFRGYRRGIVERLLTDIADSFEEVWRERADLADRLEELETEASKHRELESLLRSTLVSAERAAQDMKEQARRESDLIVQEAHAEGRRVIAGGVGGEGPARGGDPADPRLAAHRARGDREHRTRSREQETAAPPRSRRVRTAASGGSRASAQLERVRPNAADILRAVDGPTTRVRLRVSPRRRSRRHRRPPRRGLEGPRRARARARKANDAVIALLAEALSRSARRSSSSLAARARATRSSPSPACRATRSSDGSRRGGRR